MFCIPQELVEQFKAKLKSGEITPDKLSDMTSKERHQYLGSVLGEANAKSVNALFESKLLLKNQQLGIINWAKKVAGLKPEVLRDMISKVNRMDRVLNPKELDAFLEDLASQRLGFDVTYEEAANISKLAKEVSEKQEAIGKGGDRMDYGRALVKFQNYVNDLKVGIKKPLTASKIVSDVAGTAKSLKASFDNSAIFRQGWKTLWTNPGIWLKNAKQTFVDAFRTFGGKNVMDEINADILSRPNALNGNYKKAKLAVGTIEEAFPIQLPEKVPVLGRVYKASQDAFTGFVHRTRADVFDKYIEIAEKSGIELDKAQLESIGKLTNSVTSRGNLGKAEPVANLVNNVFFSPRNLKANIDILTAHTFDRNMSAFARKQAAINLMKIVSGTAAVLVIANALDEKSVEEDPRSADFGKIRVGDTRFDVSGGMSGIVTLATRLIRQSTKSSTTGKVSEINTGKFGSMTGTDLIYNFFENKLSPVAAVVKDLIKGETFSGEKPTVLGEAKNLLVPLPLTNYEELQKNPNSANTLISIIADALGIGTNTYSKKPKPIKF